MVRARETVMRKTISIGAQDFAELREQDCFYIDKTELIKPNIPNKLYTAA